MNFHRTIWLFVDKKTGRLFQCKLYLCFFFFFSWIWNKLLGFISYSILLGWMPGNKLIAKIRNGSKSEQHQKCKKKLPDPPPYHWQEWRGNPWTLLGLTSPWSPDTLTLTTAAYLVTINMTIITSFTFFDIISHLLLLTCGTKVIPHLLIPLRSFLSSFQPLFHQWHLLSFFELETLWISMQ